MSPVSLRQAPPNVSAVHARPTPISTVLCAEQSQSASRQAVNLPKRVLSVQERLKALKRVQDQAEKRVNLGMQLFRAAQSHTAHRQSLLQQLTKDQQKLKQDLLEDMARSLRAYDEWIGKMDHDFTKALKSLENRIDQLQENWGKSQLRIDDMVRRSERLLDQSRLMVSSSAKTLASVATTHSPTQTPERSPAPLVSPAPVAEPLSAAKPAAKALREVEASIEAMHRDPPEPDAVEPGGSDDGPDGHNEKSSAAEHVYQQVVEKMNQYIDRPK